MQKMSSLTNGFVQLPPSEKQKDYMVDLIRSYNVGMAKLKQYVYDPQSSDEEGYDYNNPDELIKKVGMTPKQEIMLTTVLTNELKSYISKSKDIPVYQIKLRMTHIKDIKVDYDYLTELVNKLLNAVHNGDEKEADETKEKIDQFANGLEDRIYATKIINAADAIRKGEYPPSGSNFAYPANLKDCEKVILAANTVSIDRVFINFRGKWGITDIVTNAGMRELFSRHHYGKQDLDDTGIISDIIKKASTEYNNMALDEEIQNLSKIKYRNGLREAIYKLADDMSER